MTLALQRRRWCRAPMPLVTAVVLVYAAGLLTGFGGAVLWTAGGAAFVIVFAVRTPADRLALLAVCVAGLATATATRNTVTSCGASLARAHAWRVTLVADAAPGGFVAARSECGTDVRIAVESGQAPAGARVIVTGAAVTSRGTLMITAATIAEER